MVRTIEIPGDQIEVHTDIGPGRIVSAVLTIEDERPDSPNLPPNVRSLPPLSYEEDAFGKELDDLLALAPKNAYPCDDSREAIYGPDPGEDEST